MSRQRLVVIAAIAAAVVGAGIWLLWPKSMDDSAATATAGPYLVRLTGESPKVGISPVTVEITGNGGQPHAGLGHLRTRDAPNGPCHNTCGRRGRR